MQRLKRLRPRMLRLWWTFVVLGACSAVFAFFVGRELETNFATILYSSLGAALILLWLLPTLSFLGTFCDLFANQIVTRNGIFGMKARTVLLSEIESVTASAIRGVVIVVRDQEPLVLKGYAKPKAIAAELNALAK